MHRLHKPRGMHDVPTLHKGNDKMTLHKDTVEDPQAYAAGASVNSSKQETDWRRDSLDTQDI